MGKRWETEKNGRDKESKNRRDKEVRMTKRWKKKNDKEMREEEWKRDGRRRRMGETEKVRMEI